MTPEMRRAAAALVALALLGCAQWSALREGVERRLPGRVELSFDRPSDLPPPEGLHPTSTADRSISLAWHPVLVGDVAGYAVMRAADPRAPFELLVRTDSRFAAIATDAGEIEGALGDGTTWHYKVHPYDSQGRVSRSHAYVPATTDPPPSVPEGRSCAFSNSTATRSWFGG